MERKKKQNSEFWFKLGGLAAVKCRIHLKQCLSKFRGEKGVQEGVICLLGCVY